MLVQKSLIIHVQSSVQSSVHKWVVIIASTNSVPQPLTSNKDPYGSSSAFVVKYPQWQKQLNLFLGASGQVSYNPIIENEIPLKTLSSLVSSIQSSFSDVSPQGVHSLLFLSVLPQHRDPISEKHNNLHYLYFTLLPGLQSHDQWRTDHLILVQQTWTRIRWNFRAISPLQ